MSSSIISSVKLGKELSNGLLQARRMFLGTGGKSSKFEIRWPMDITTTNGVVLLLATTLYPQGISG